MTPLAAPAPDNLLVLPSHNHQTKKSMTQSALQQVTGPYNTGRPNNKLRVPVALPDSPLSLARSLARVLSLRPSLSLPSLAPCSWPALASAPTSPYIRLVSSPQPPKTLNKKRCFAHASNRLDRPLFNPPPRDIIPCAAMESAEKVILFAFSPSGAHTRRGKANVYIALHAFICGCIHAMHLDRR